MSCGRMEKKILAYVDGRLKESERLEVEKHLTGCAVCRLRVNEFRAVNTLLGELPEIEPSPAFDARVRARVAAEPAKRNWWAWVMPSPRVAFAASMLLLATVWLGSRSVGPAVDHTLSPRDEAVINQNLPVLENFDVLANFEPLTDLSQSPSPDDDDQQDANQQYER